MNKLFTKIATAIAGFAMVVGVGVGIAHNRARGVYADTIAFSSNPVINYDTVAQTAGNTATVSLGTDYSVFWDGTGNNSKVTANNPWRVYANHTLCFSTTSSSYLGKIVLTIDSSSSSYKGNFSADYGNVTQATNNNLFVTWQLSVLAEKAKSVTLSTSSQARISHIDIYTLDEENSSAGGSSSSISSSSVAPVTYAVTYDANGGTGTTTDVNSPYVKDTNATVISNSFSRSGYTFTHWDTASNDSGTDYDPNDTFKVTANTVLYAQWNQNLGDLTGETGTINFGSADGSFNANKVKIYGKDSLGVAWKVTTAGTTSFTANASYSQIGSSSSPATSITIEAPNLGNTYKVTSFSATFGGFSGTAGAIALKVGNTTVASGSLNAGNNVTVSNTSCSAKASSLSITITSIAKGVKITSLSYTLASPIETQTITASADSAYSDETISLETNAESATWTITSNTAGASLSNENAKTTVVSATQPGSVTVQAVAALYTTVSKTLTFTQRPAGNWYDVDFDSNGGSNSPESLYLQENDTFEFPSPGTREHYTFDGWTSTGSAPYYSAGATSPAVTAAVTYTAHWTEDAKYTVTYVAGDNGTGSYAEENVYVGTYTLKAFANLSGVTASDGYRFKNYTVGGSNKNPGDTFTLNSATTVIVNFELIPLVDTLTAAYIDQATYGDWTGLAGTNTSAVYAGNSQTSTNSAIQIRTKNENSGIVSTSSGGKLQSITVSWNATDFSQQTNRKLDVYGKNEAYTDATDLYNVNTQGTKIGTITYTNSTSYETELTVTGYYRYVGLRSNDGALYFNEINIEWATTNAQEMIESTITTQSILAYHYEGNTTDGFEYSNISMRFGGSINETLWNELDTNNHLISGFGVMIASGVMYDENTTIKDNLNMAALAEANPAPDIDDGDIVDYYMTVGEMPNAVHQDGKYTWNLFQTIDEAETNKVFTATAYIKVGSNYVFMKQVSYSVETLAADYIANRGCDSSTAGGSLDYLAA